MGQDTSLVIKLIEYHLIVCQALTASAICVCVCVYESRGIACNTTRGEQSQHRSTDRDKLAVSFVVLNWPCLDAAAAAVCVCVYVLKLIAGYLQTVHTQKALLHTLRPIGDVIK